MTEPKVTHAFELDHIDRSDGTARRLAVQVDDQGKTYLWFITNIPGDSEYRTMVPLTQIGLNMLSHAVRILEQDLDSYARPEHTH